MTNVGDIVAFIRARLDEDERTARAAGHPEQPRAGEHWQWEYAESDHPLLDTPVDIYSGDADGYIGEGADVGLRSVEFPGDNPHLALHDCEEVEAGVAQHIARHDPARVLRGVDADRRIVDEHGSLFRADRPCPIDFQHLCSVCGNAIEGWPCTTLRLLAAKWSDHEDYRQEWTP